MLCDVHLYQDLEKAQLSHLLVARGGVGIEDRD